MISIKALITDPVRQCQAKTDLTVTTLCMAVNESHDQHVCPNPAITVNEIHSLVMTFMAHLTQLTFSKGY